jgi:hypothetical protein
MNGSLMNLGNHTPTWRTSGVKQPGEVPTRTEFPPELVARLREAAQKPNGNPSPATATKQTAPPKKDDTAVFTTPTPRPPVKRRDVPHVAPSDFPTLATLADATLAEKGAFVRRYYPMWQAYQLEHELMLKEMLALTGMSQSSWHNHRILHNKHPERYGENGVHPGVKSKPLPHKE